MQGLYIFHPVPCFGDTALIIPQYGHARRQCSEKRPYRKNQCRLTPLIQGMVTVYHGEVPAQDDALPRLEEPPIIVTDSSTGGIHFDFTDSIGTDPAKDAHMHALTIRYIGKDTIKKKWVMYQDGQPVHSSTFRQQRAEQL